MLHDEFVEDIPTCPAQSRRQRQHKAQQRDVLPIQTGLRQNQHAKHRDGDPRQLFALQALTKDKRAKNDGEKRLSLENQ
ncbi:hypothetical protein D3C85_1572200 [compost metagenome]